MWSAQAVLACALSLLSRGEGTLPRIEFVDIVPPGLSAGAEGFVRPGHDTIYLITSSSAFRRARAANFPCGASDALKKVASVIVHEEWHVRHGSDEAGAYFAQLMTLMRLNAGPGTPLYYEVSRAMRTVVRLREPASRIAAARSAPRSDPAASVAMARPQHLWIVTTW